MKKIKCLDCTTESILSEEEEMCPCCDSEKIQILNEINEHVYTCKECFYEDIKSNLKKVGGMLTCPICDGPMK
jgi:Zn finger protein HypA/HybF involved in hydrogenase expression